MAATRDEEELAKEPGATADGGPEAGEGRQEPAPPPHGRQGDETPLEQAQRILGVNAAALAGKLREARQQKGWTRTKLAQKAGLAPSTVSNLERERSETPDPVTALALALALGYRSVAELMGEAPGPGTGGAPGPGPMSLAGLIEGLLRGVWAAQDARPPQTQTNAKQAVLEEHVAHAEEVLRAASATTHPILAVGVVVLNEPRTLG